MNQSTVASSNPPATSTAAPRWLTGLREDFAQIFVEEWSPYLGAPLLVLVAAVLMVNGLFWGVFGGLKLWGDWFNNLIGLGPVLGIPGTLESPLMQRISLMDITLIIGALTAALFSGQFALRRPPKVEYVTAAIGGVFMGIGASFAGGCTTGGFFTPALFSSPAGWAMWVGLLPGAFIGLKAVLWISEHVTWGMAAPATTVVSPGAKRIYPWIGFAIVAGIVWWATAWYGSSDTKLVARGIVILSGFAFGFILHRSRFCFARVFREPFMTGEGTMTKAMIWALALGIPVSAMMLQYKMVDPFLAIPATFWLGSLLGGLIFGVGMVLAGGCASGSMWRMGEGHIKLWVAVFFFSWTGSTFTAVANHWDLLTREMSLDLVEVSKVGQQSYLPDMLGGWSWTYLLSFGILLVWYLLVRYNESTEKFTVL
jgi:uncharacterized membrane protein YedE/YeeE